MPEGRFLADTVNVASGQRYNLIWTALPSVHCHVRWQTAKA